MIFALAAGDHGLMVFATQTEAAAHCAAADVANGGWAFYAHDGAPLKAYFLPPPKPGTPDGPSQHAQYVLRPAPHLPPLAPRLRTVAYIGGAAGVSSGVSSVADVERLLAAALREAR